MIPARLTAGQPATGFGVDVGFGVGVGLSVGVGGSAATGEVVGDAVEAVGAVAGVWVTGALPHAATTNPRRRDAARRFAFTSPPPLGLWVGPR